MNLMLSAHPMTPPHWSPYAVIAGILIGFVIGGLAIGLYALRLARRSSECEVFDG